MSMSRTRACLANRRPKIKLPRMHRCMRAKKKVSTNRTSVERVQSLRVQCLALIRSGLRQAQAERPPSVAGSPDPLCFVLPLGAAPDRGGDSLFWNFLLDLVGQLVKWLV